MSDYIPTTDEVREAYATGFRLYMDRSVSRANRRDAKKIVPIAEAAFDRWLEQVKAEVWEECANELSKYGTAQIPDNPYKEQE